ncbi:MAG: fibronectin type III domain-containing protein, partial [Petrimonas sp.]|nr:fibronectin type III domain-containing protein [Petrimonas sp.]
MQILRYRIEQWNGSGWSGYSTSYQSQSLLNGLAAETTYRFRIFAEDLSYNATVDFLEVSFTTTARDLTAPIWPAQVTYALSEQTDTSFIMEWPEAYDVSGIRLYQIYIWDAINQEYRTFSTSNRSWHANGFARGDIVTGYITAEDQRGNRISRADGIPFTVQIAPEDTTPPSWPVGSTMTIHEVAPTLVELSWSSANTTAEQAGMSDSLLYIIRALDTQQNEVRSTSVGQNIQQWAIGPLDPGETYTIKVEARDRYGNTSTDGPQAIVQTPQTDDSAPWWPVDPSFRVYRIQQNNEGTYHVMFEWSQATDFNMRYYELTAVDENNNAPASSPTTTQQTSWHLWGMQPGRTYTVQVVAVDSYGHRSQPLTTAVRIPGIADSMNLLAVEQPLISSKETLTLLSEPVKVTYDPQAVHITKVTMQQTDGRRVDFTPVGKFPYVFVPGMNFRFDVEFDKPERVEEMRIHAANGAELGGAVGASGGAIPLLGAVAVSGGLNGTKTIPGAIYVSTVQTPQSFAMSTIPTFNEAAIRSGLPSAYAYATMAEDTTYDDGDAETATVRKTGTLSDPRLKLETTATYRPLYEHTEASSDIVRIAAGGVPLYDFSW